MRRCAIKPRWAPFLKCQTSNLEVAMRPDVQLSFRRLESCKAIDNKSRRGKGRAKLVFELVTGSLTKVAREMRQVDARHKVVLNPFDAAARGLSAWNLSF